MNGYVWFVVGVVAMAVGLHVVGAAVRWFERRKGGDLTGVLDSLGEPVVPMAEYETSDRVHIECFDAWVDGLTVTDECARILGVRT